MRPCGSPGRLHLDGPRRFPRGTSTPPSPWARCCTASLRFRTPSPPWAFRSLGASRGGVYSMSFACGDETSDAGLEPAVFSTGPGVRHTFCHFLTECLATAMLIFGIFVIFSKNVMGTADFVSGFGAFLVALLIRAMGMAHGIRPQSGPRPRPPHGPRPFCLLRARDLLTGDMPGFLGWLPSVVELPHSRSARLWGCRRPCVLTGSCPMCPVLWWANSDLEVKT